LGIESFVIGIYLVPDVVPDVFARYPFPKYVGFTFHHLVNVILEVFIVPYRNPFPEIVVVAYSGEVVVPAELGLLSRAYQIVEDLLLKPVGFNRPLSGL
jgi:hypothetical protein